MGYCVRFKGRFALDKAMSAEHAATLREYQDSEEWPGETPDRRFNPWLLSEDGLAFEVRTDKPGDWKAWLQYLIDAWLTPWGYTLSGSVEWKGEERGDAGTITIDGGRVKASRPKLALTWSDIGHDSRRRIQRGMEEAMTNDYDRFGDAWLAAMDALGIAPTSDRTEFDD